MIDVPMKPISETKPDDFVAPSQALVLPSDKHAAITKPRAKRDRPESIVNITTAIANITSEVGQVSKQGYNKFHGYRYVTMENVLQKLTPLLGKYGLIIMQTEISRAMFDDDRVVSVQYAFTIAHNSGEIWPDRPVQTGVCRCRDSKGGWDDKALNKCHTAARKYFLLALFQIATGEEDDADEHQSGGRQREIRRPSYPDQVLTPKIQVEFDPTTGEIIDPAPAPSQGRQDTPSDRSQRTEGQPPPVETPHTPAGGGTVVTNTTAVVPKDAPIFDVKDNAGVGRGHTLSEELQAEDERLLRAAENGMEQLRLVWAQVPNRLRPYLVEAKETRYKPIANEADEQHRANQPERRF